MLLSVEVMVWECLPEGPFEERSGSTEEEFRVGTREDPTEGVASAKALGWILFAMFTARSLVWLVCACVCVWGGLHSHL